MSFGRRIDGGYEAGGCAASGHRPPDGSRERSSRQYTDDRADSECIMWKLQALANRTGVTMNYRGVTKHPDTFFILRSCLAAVPFRSFRSTKIRSYFLGITTERQQCVAQVVEAIETRGVEGLSSPVLLDPVQGLPRFRGQASPTS